MPMLIVHPGASLRSRPGRVHPRHLIGRIRPVFFDEARATVANSGASGRGPLALTDPDSNEVVPSGAARFAGTSC